MAGMLGVCVVLPSLLLLAGHAHGMVLPDDQKVAEVRNALTNMTTQPEKLKAFVEKMLWSARTIYSEHIDKKMLVDLAPDGNMGQIEVKMKMHLNRINDLDLEHGVLDSLAWLDLSWEDSRWSWAGKLDLPKWMFPAKMVWKPDIMLWNDVSAGGHVTLMEDVRVHIYSSGKIVYVPPMHIQSACDGLQEHYNSGDVVNCTMKFGSWVNEERRLKPVIDGEGIMDHTSEQPNHKWKVVGVHGEKHSPTYADAVYSYIEYTITLQRN